MPVSPKLTTLIAEQRSLALESATASLDMRVDMLVSWAENRRRVQEEVSAEIWSRDTEHVIETAA